MIVRFVGLVLFVTLSSWFHPVHVSVTNVDLEPETGMINVSVKLFSDDFEDLILRKYGVQMSITLQENPEKHIAAINRYIGDALQFTINGGQEIEMDFSGSELNHEAIWLSYMGVSGQRIRKMEVRNELMLDKFEDQTNLMIVSYGDQQNGYRLNNKNTELSFNIK